MRFRTLHFMTLGLAATVGGIIATAAFAQAAETGDGGSSMVSGAAHKHSVEPHQANQDKQAPPRLLNLGPHTFAVSTRNKLAQQYINQGLNLSYAFNHAEAGRAFREAARLDPPLAMAYWGQALVLGPNINAPMDPEDEAPALELVQKAASLAAKASPRERAMIGALEKRYTGNAEQRKANNKAYADAMREVHAGFPDDLDIAMLYVESVMDLNAWGYWMRDGYPLEGTEEIVALTEEVMRRNPKHPGAVHMYIHLIEPTNTPERAEKAADTLLTLMPAAGHAVHMPSHIYQRVGRYADSIKSNQLAIAADEEYLAHRHAQGMYPIMYYPHNIHFLWFAATSDGQSKLAIESARSVAGQVNDAVLKEVPAAAAFRAVPYWALARFGKWNELLQEPAPPLMNAFLKGGWHYARGLAFVATGQLQQAEQELAALREIMKNGSLDWQLMSPNTARGVLSIGPEVLAGEIAAARGQFDSAIAHLERAVRLEDGLIYTEPAEWQSPPRLALGAILMESGRPAEAETVYWEDLRRNRNNGWALYGLLQALRAQKKDDRATLIEARFKKAWERADVALNASRFGCIAAPRQE
jgi:tetratricopeptide (TPR) repeat protein